jgi:N-acetylmuramoyl-L-alanine amidase
LESVTREINPSTELKTRILYFLLAWSTCSVGSVAQNASPLTSISIATRSDQLGHVVRFHLSSPADSVKLFQPSADLIQVVLYKGGIRPDLVQKPTLQAPFTRLDLTSIPGGIGIDIRLKSGHFVLARAYPDANGRHTLVGLTRATKREVDVLTNGMKPIDWAAIGRSESLRGDAAVADTLLPPQPVPVVRPPVGGYAGRLHTIVIDPGHGGRDPGAIGPRGTQEKDVVLRVSLLLGELIEKNMPDVKVVYTRRDDRFIELHQRGRIANQAKGELFISVHANSSRVSKAFGAEVFFLGMHRTEDALEVMKKENSVIALEDPATRTRELTDEELILYELTNAAFLSSSQYFAALIDREFIGHAKRHSRGVKQAGFLVLYNASMPSVLVEIGFISNPTEELYIRSAAGQRELATAIYRAVEEYRNRLERR